MENPVRITNVGDTAFNVEFGAIVDRAVNARVVGLYEAVERERENGGLAGLIEAVPTFRSLLVSFDPLATTRAAMESAVTGLIGVAGAAPTAVERRWRIPVCYGGEFGPDLDEVAALCRLSPDAVIARHAADSYFVYMLGFMPGLAYMGTVPQELRLPRRATPRVRVPAGSVAMAAELSTIYPWESPGGWHILGRTPVTLFDLEREPPVLLRPGDHVRFDAIGPDAFEALRRDPSLCEPEQLLERSS